MRTFGEQVKVMLPMGGGSYEGRFLREANGIVWVEVTKVGDSAYHLGSEVPALPQNVSAL